MDQSRNESGRLLRHSNYFVADNFLLRFVRSAGAAAAADVDLRRRGLGVPPAAEQVNALLAASGYARFENMVEAFVG